MSRPYQRRGTGNASTSQRGGHQTSRGGARRPEQSTGPRNQPTNSSQAVPQRPLQQRPPKIQYPIYSWRIFSPNASIRYARDIPTTDFYLSMLSGNILGFDLEWQPTFVKGGSRNPVALVQLADANVMILIQVSAMQGDIYSILCCPAYPKVRNHRISSNTQNCFRESSYRENWGGNSR